MTPRQQVLPLFAACFFLTVSTGCGVPVPLGPASDAVFDADLVGLWETTPGSEEGQMLVLQFNEREYYVELREAGTAPFDEDALRLRAYLTDVEGQRFVNVHSIDAGEDEREYVFFVYAFEPGGVLAVTEVNDVGEQQLKSFETSEALVAFVRENAGNPALYGESMRFVRLEPVD